jgi:hypothetical protein
VRHLVLLLRLRLLLGLRSFAGKPGRAALAMTAVAVLVPLGFGALFGLYVVTQGTPPEARPGFGALVCSVAALSLIFGPNAARPAGGLPLSRCLLWPVRRGVLLSAGMLGGLVGGPGVLALPALLGFVVGLGLDAPGAVAVRVALLALLLVHSIALGGLIGLAGAWLLRARRARELAMVLSPLLVLGFWIGMSTLGGPGPEGFGRSIDIVAALFPPAHLGRAIGGVGPGTAVAVWWPAVAWIAPLTVALVWLDTRLFARLVEAESLGAPRAGATAGWAAALRLPRLLPAPAGEVVWREWIFAFREPGYRLYLMQFGMLALLPIFVMIAFQTGRDGSGAVPMLAILGLMLLTKEWRLCSNLLGLEGFGLRYTLSLPIDRSRLLLGKAAAHGLLFAVINAAVLGVAGLLLQAPRPALVVLLAVEAALLVLLGAGALITVHLPHRMAARGRSAIEGTEAAYEDWGTGCLRSLAGWAAFAAAAPPAFAVAGVGLLGPGGWGWFDGLFVAGALCFALTYGIVALAYGVTRAGALLPLKEQQMIEIMEE